MAWTMWALALVVVLARPSDDFAMSRAGDSGPADRWVYRCEEHGRERGYDDEQRLPPLCHGVPMPLVASPRDGR